MNSEAAALVAFMCAVAFIGITAWAIICLPVATGFYLYDRYIRKESPSWKRYYLSLFDIVMPKDFRSRDGT